VTLYKHTRHPWRDERASHGPVKVADQHAQGGAATRFNARFAVVITRAVGSMWCAYGFALFDMISLPDAIRAGTAAIVSWVAQTFLQLVLLSIIMVGQDVQGKAADKRSESTYQDAEVIMHGNEQIAEHLTTQDAQITEILAQVQQILDHLTQG
jgi:hypothetical protein